MARLAESSYGKREVRLTKVVRTAELHTLYELTVAITLGGLFDRVYTDGDNSSCIPTDTMKNTVYALARMREFDGPEVFARILADHFLTFPQVTWAEVDIEAASWTRISVDGGPHPHAFTRGGSGSRTGRVRAERNHPTRTWGGLTGLEVLKTTGSGFRGFHRDRYTTLAETSDRIFATAIDASWEYAPDAAVPSAVFEAARDSLLETFATHPSASVQQTIHAMGEALLARVPQITSVSLSLPNQHRLLVNLQPFGLDNPNQIFVATSEPYGLIQGTMTRE